MQKTNSRRLSFRQNLKAGVVTFTMAILAGASIAPGAVAILL